MDVKLEEYRKIVTRNEDLKSEERLLNAMLNNLVQMRELIIEKEKLFCDEDQRLRCNSEGSLRQRCHNLIDHLVHFKCIIECLATDVLNMGSNIINDDEYISLSLTYRQAELMILQAIKTNQQRGLRIDETGSNLLEVESEWRREHNEKRKLMACLLHDHSNFLVDKTRNNLDQQKVLLNNRYQFITTLQL